MLRHWRLIGPVLVLLALLPAISLAQGSSTSRSAEVRAALAAVLALGVAVGVPTLAARAPDPTPDANPALVPVALPAAEPAPRRALCSARKPGTSPLLLKSPQIPQLAQVPPRSSH